jgi:transposase InsO family protein
VSELHYPAVEKEATSIIEAVRKWRHLLSGRHFILLTDQRSVAFMLDNRRRTKIKNNKIQEWRMELASYSYSIKYRPGKENTGPDSFTRMFCNAVDRNGLHDIHVNLCHPGVTRLLHYVRSKNLPYSTDDVKKTCSNCKTCAELKPQFYRKPEGTLIHATKPMERLSIDFKGPLPSTSRNIYLLTIVDEYSRYPFAYACPNMHTSTVINCLNQLFSFCGMPSFIHSDRGLSFMSRELNSYLTQRGIATSKSTPYHPTGNSQVERYNGIIWKTVNLALKSRNMPTPHWEVVLPEALHCVRSLLSTSTNVTPHERFFAFQRRSPTGISLPTWLTDSDKVLLRKFVRPNKYEPLVQEVQIVDVNPQYAHVRFPDGRESTVSLQDLAPLPSNTQNNQYQPSVIEPNDAMPTVKLEPELENESVETVLDADIMQQLRRSNRISKVPERYGYDNSTT